MDIHPDFMELLKYRDEELIDLFKDLRTFVIAQCPECSEILYNTHALSAVFSLSDRLTDAFCHIPIYTRHLNLGFNKGALLDDRHGLLKGSGMWIRHKKVRESTDYRRPEVIGLLQEAIQKSRAEMEQPPQSAGNTLSKIKKQL